MRRLILRAFSSRRTVCLVALLALLGIPALPQDDTGISIRVDSREVVVPVFVIHKNVRLHEGFDLRSSWYEWDQEVTGLKAQNFRIFQDGVEQAIKNVSVQGIPVRNVYDNFNVHEDYLCTPTGLWSTPDTKPGSIVFPTASNPNMYLISYVPPVSEEGSCHKVKVKLTGAAGTVYSRDEYCNKPHSASDPLYGGALGSKLEGFAAGLQPGKLQLSASSAWFFTDPDHSRVYVWLAFPPDQLKRQSKPDGLDATIVVLGFVDDKDSQRVMRFSDAACAVSAKFWNYFRGPLAGHSEKVKNALDRAAIPERYQTEFDLAPAEYRLRLILSDGEDFGRIELPLSVDRFDPKKIAISSLVLCNRFGQADQKTTAPNLTTKFPPLVSDGMEFTPSTTNRFAPSDPLALYFEIYEPALTQTGSAAQVRYRIRIVKQDTGETKVDSCLRDAARFQVPNSPVVPISQSIDLAKFAAGAYRIEVQGTDSSGQETVWRSSVLIVE